MEFKSIMHIAFYTGQMEEMMDFYINKLGLKTKIITRASIYKGLNRGYYSEVAETDPDKIIIVYIEVAQGQFIELFPKMDGQQEHDEWNQRIGYSHFALLVDDIKKTREEFIKRNITLDTDISIGPSQTYQMWAHDPDGNKFEIMQYTEKSFQLIGSIMQDEKEVIL